MMINNPTFKIHGEERRKLKKELSQLKSFARYFWHFHQEDKDLSSFYGCSKNYPMSDENAAKKFEETNLKIKELENILSIVWN